MHDHELGVFERQHGLITRAQALEAGLSAAQVRHRVCTGSWVRVHKGLYRLALYPRTFKADLMWATLASGGLASHRSAARLHGFWDGPLLEAPEVVVARGRYRLIEGVSVHQTTQFDAVDQTVIDGIRVTGRVRTFLDLAADVSQDALQRCVEQAVALGNVTSCELWAVIEQHSVQGRTGCGPLRAVLRRDDASLLRQ